MQSGRCWPTAELTSPGGGGKQPRHRSRPPEPTTRSPPLQVGLSGVLVGVTRRLQVAEHGRRWQDGKTVPRQIPSRVTSPRAIQKQKNPCEGRCCRHIAGVSEAEAPVGVEPTMADLQSAALATWLRSRSLSIDGSFDRHQPEAVTLREDGAFGQAVLITLTWPVRPPNTAVPILPMKSAVRPRFLQSVLGPVCCGCSYSSGPELPRPSDRGLLGLPTTAKPEQNLQSLARGQKDRYSLGSPISRSAESCRPRQMRHTHPQCPHKQ